jgi:excisionase family DNA binding protein
MNDAAARQSDVSGPLLDANGAADLLTVPASWLLREARAERIPHVRLGRYVRFDADELREWTRSVCAAGPRTGSRPVPRKKRTR